VGGGHSQEPRLEMSMEDCRMVKRHTVKKVRPA
jgi:hypothetical protein